MNETSFRPRNLSICLACVSAVLLCVALFIYNSGHSLAMIPACTAAAMTVLLALLAVGRTIFQRRQNQEEHDAAEYHRQHGNADLFGDADEAVKLATRSNRQYVRYFIPVATIALGVVLGIFVLICWMRWKNLAVTSMAPAPLPMAILAFCCCIGTLIGGSFFIGVSRENGCRWLRPGAAWLFLSGFLCLLGSIVYFCEHFKKFTDTIDLTLARTGLVVLAILAVELILSFVIEFYRPRMPNEAERPLPESRLLALFTEPGSLARNVADSLDYQFGFRVSDAWFYHFLERTIVPLFMVMVAAFWLMTCIVVVEPSETALRERFGKLVTKTPFGPGVYFKLPYPFETIYRFSSDRVQQLTIEGHAKKENAPEQPGDDGHGHGHGGEKQAEEREESALIVWDIEKNHGDEADFLVGAHSRVASVNVTLENAQDKYGVGLLSAHIPLFFRVKDLYLYSYQNSNTQQILKNVAQRELLNYFIQHDWNELLGAGRGDATKTMRERIQKSADDLDLGVEVVFVALTGLHPPVGVGKSFDNVTSSMVRKGTEVQRAKTEQHRSIWFAQAAATVVRNQASIYRNTQTTQAEADASRFASQLLCYRASPRIFMLNSYYEILEQNGRNVRKYIVTGKSGDEVLWLNLEQKARSGLMDLNLSGN